MGSQTTVNSPVWLIQNNIKKHINSALHAFVGWIGWNMVHWYIRRVCTIFHTNVTLTNILKMKSLWYCIFAPVVLLKNWKCVKKHTDMIVRPQFWIWHKKLNSLRYRHPDWKILHSKRKWALINVSLFTLLYTWCLIWFNLNQKWINQSWYITVTS